MVRGLFLSIKEKEFVEAARASGASSWRIMFRHILPNIVGPIVVNTTLVVGAAILLESTLSFLGFGVKPPAVSLGSMLARSESAVGTKTSYLIYFPGWSSWSSCSASTSSATGSGTPSTRSPRH